jgi:peroxiredoxin
MAVGADWFSCGSKASVEKQSPQRLVMPDGDRVTIDQLAPQRATALVVMKSPWCSVCQKQLKALSERETCTTGIDAAVFGMTASDASTNHKLQRKLELSFPVVGDPDGQYLRKMGLWNHEAERPIPGVIYLNEQGEAVDVYRGRYPGKSQTGRILRKLQTIGSSQ